MVWEFLISMNYKVIVWVFLLVIKGEKAFIKLSNKIQICFLIFSIFDCIINNSIGERHYGD